MKEGGGGTVAHLHFEDKESAHLHFEDKSHRAQGTGHRYNSFLKFHR